MSLDNGNGKLSGAALAAPEVDSRPLLLWLCWTEAERDALRAIGLDACTREGCNPDGRHLVIVTGTGQVYAIAGAPDIAQLLYGAGAETVRIICVPTDRGCTAADLLANGVLLLCDLEEMAEKAEPVADAHIEPWPELTIQETPAGIPFPVEVFEPPLQRFCKGVGQVTLTPPEMAGCAMLAVASAAIGQSCQILVKRTWKESPQLYLLTVADPGKMKTPVIKLVGAPLTRIDARLRDESIMARALWESQKKACVKGQDPGEEPRQRRAIVKDITRETLAAILRDNPRGVFCDPDEATAWVSSFNEYKAKGSDRQFWLSNWSGTPISVDREGGRRNIFVRSPLVTVHGGIPPDMIDSLGEEHGRNDGFVDRILFCFPHAFPRQEWTEDELDQGDEITWDSVVKMLHALELCREDSGETHPHFIGLDQDAKVAYVAWYNAHCQESESLDMPPGFVGLWSKLRAYCLRFALILSRLRLAMDPECSTLHKAPVRLRDVEGAIALIDYFKSQFLRINHRLTDGTGSREACAVLAWIERKGATEFREREIRKDLVRRFPTAKDLKPALDCLVEAGAIRGKIEPEDPHRKGRKPTQAYEVNPTLRGRRELDKLDKKPFSGASEG